MALDKIKTAMIEDDAVTLAKAANTIASVAEVNVVESDADKIQTNLAILAFKTAATGSLAKYSLKDQIIDEFVDASGIDGTPSTNHVLAGGVYSSTITETKPTGGDSTDTSVSGYTTLVFNTSRALTVTTSGNVSILAVGGGGSGGSDYGGGGGAGGLVYDAVYAVTANTYDIVRGTGGLGVSAVDTDGNNGADTTVHINGGAMQFTAKGGGAGSGENGNNNGVAGGSGGGGSYGPATNGTGGATTQAGISQHGAVDVNIGYVGGQGYGASDYNPAGGGGAGGAGGAGTSPKSGDGGVGYNASAIFGTAVGDSGWFASGGGGGWVSNYNSVAGSASDGGGTAGGTPSGGNAAAATANTGGGSGGGASESGASGNGGSGVVLVRYANADFATTYSNLTLQSTDTTAETEADYADMVMLIEDTVGTATINTDIKGYISEDSGVTFTEGVLVDEGDWGTNKRILAFHDLDISAQSGTAMCYKITTHNQAVGKQTKIHATSIGWR